MHMLQFLLIVLFDGGGVEAGHGAEVVGAGGLECIETGCGGGVDIGQEHGGDASIDGTGDGLVAVVVESLVVQVAVGVDEGQHVSLCDWMRSVIRS